MQIDALLSNGNIKYISTEKGFLQSVYQPKGRSLLVYIFWVSRHPFEQMLLAGFNKTTMHPSLLVSLN
jgi:hypothetical protein